MGYTTNFRGSLKFTTPLSVEDILYLNNFLGEDFRDHPEWESEDEYATYIDLELLQDQSGIKWNGGEKTSGMVASVNLIIKEMRKIKPDFQLSGKLEAQGEEVGDHWFLVIEDGFAKEVSAIANGEKITCPHCNEQFYLNSK